MNKLILRVFLLSEETAIKIVTKDSDEVEWVTIAMNEEPLNHIELTTNAVSLKPFKSWEYKTNKQRVRFLLLEKNTLHYAMMTRA